MARIPGVTLLKADKERRIGYRIRFVDPDTGKTVNQTIPPDYARTEKLRKAWAKKKSGDLNRRREALEDGAPRITRTTVAEGVKVYFEGSRIQGASRLAYEGSARKFLAWCEANKIRYLADLTKPRLIKFRESIEQEPTSRPGRRNAAQPDADGVIRRSAFSVNRELRGLSVILRDLHDRDMLAMLSEADIKKGLKRRPASPEKISWLRSAELRQLIGVMIDRDAVTYQETRAEKSGGSRGGTARYEAIAPFGVLVLLSGMRVGEALKIRWEDITLDAVTADGKPTGAIGIRASGTKKRQPREIDLTVSPALHALLLALKKQATPKKGAQPKGRVFPRLTHAGIETAMKRLREHHGAPEAFTWHTLRRTCSTFLVSSPNIFGAASAFRSAKMLGHSVQVASEFYTGVAPVDHEARTLEGAMGVTDMVQRVIDGVGSSAGKGV